MENSTNFLYVTFFISICLHVAAGIIVAAFIIPLQFKEIRVKNGLVRLRKQMLTKGVLSLVVVVASVLALTSRYFIPDPNISRYIITTMILTHAIGTLAKSYIEYQIYHQQYSLESRQMHERIDKLEKADARKHK